MAAKKAAKKAATRAATKPVAVIDVNDVLKRLGVYYDADTSKFEEDDIQRPEPFGFFCPDENDDNVSYLPHTCAVLVFGGFMDPSDEGYTDLSDEEKTVLFKYAVYESLRSANRRQAVATTTQNQKQVAAWLEAAGFEPVNSAVNPSTSSVVTIWVLSI